MSAKLPWEIVRVAEEQCKLEIRESSKNRGDGIEKFWTATSYDEGYKDRQPWCAAFVCWVVREAMTRLGIPQTATFKRPETALAFGFISWSLAQDLSTQTRLSPGEDIQPGDLVVFEWHHIGFAVSGASDGVFETIEGNTGPSGGSTSNEGDGMYRKMRKVSGVKARIRFRV